MNPTIAPTPDVLLHELDPALELAGDTTSP